MKNPTITESSASRIVVFEEDPEVNAMSQALYSRSPRSILDHLAKIELDGPDKFMGSYYVGYGHKSIGDCGTTTIAIEGASMLAAKAIQDWPLYSGQEASTRYLDMRQQPLHDLGNETGRSIQRELMALYERILSELIPYLKTLFPQEEGQEFKVWEKAIKAKAFDIARGFLPAGLGTYVSWHTNLRQAHDHLLGLEHHPLLEVRSIARATRDTLRQRYPSSFSHKEYPDQQGYYASVWRDLTYSDFDGIRGGFDYTSRLNTSLSRYTAALASRPQKTELPPVVRNAGTLTFRFLLDFGSFRDLQRHRSVTCPMPLLTLRHGFNPWYLDALPESLRYEVVVALAEIEKRLSVLEISGEVSKEDLQYFIPMGHQVSCEVDATIPAAVYIAELRSSQTVHPTLRLIAQNMGTVLRREIPGIALYIDDSPDTWSIKRGNQDIVPKE